MAAICGFFCEAIPVSASNIAPNFLEWNYDAKSDGTINMYGRLYQPANYATGSSFPVVIFLHGGLQNGTDNTSQVNNHIDQLFTRAQSRGFFLYAPQNTPGQSGWSVPSMKTALIMLEKLFQTYPKADRSRVYFTGLSAGGGGTYSAIRDFKELVSGGVPLSSDYSDWTRMGNYVGKPLWIYHGLSDTTVLPTMSRAVVNKIREVEGKPPIAAIADLTGGGRYTNGSKYFEDENTMLRLSLLTGGGHNDACWNAAYSEDTMYDWLLSKTNTIAPMAVGKTVLIDFGSTDSTYFVADTQGRYWNSMSYNMGITLENVVPFAMTSDGVRTITSVKVTQKFDTNGSDYGLGTPNPGAPYDAFVAVDGWRTRTGATASVKYGEFELTGLVAGATYEVKLWASTTSSGNTTRYTINGQTASLATNLNGATKVTFPTLTADAAGKLTVKVYEANAGVGFLGALEITRLATQSPIAEDDTVPAQEWYQQPVTGLLSNDQPGAITPIWISSVGPAGHGTVTFNLQTQGITYQGEPGFSGDDFFNYTITDGTNSDTAQVTVQVASTTTASDLVAEGLTGANLGTFGSGSSREFGGGLWEILGAGTGGIAGTEDNFHFESLDRAGDFQVVVRMRGLSATGGVPRAGLMIRESNSANARMVYLSTTTGTALKTAARVTAGGAMGAETTPAPVYTYPDAWLLIERTGDVITLGVSNVDGSYTSVGQYTLAGLATSIKVGVFSASGAAGVSARAVLSDFQIVSATDAVSLWKLDETSGVSVYDSAGTQSGALSGNAAWSAAGKKGGAVSLPDGTNDYISVPDHVNYHGTAMSLALWFNPSLLDGNARGIISKRSGVGTQSAFSVFLSTGNRIFVDLPNNTNRFDTGFAVPAINQWYHLAVVFDGTITTGRLTVYVNGTSVYQATPSATAIPDTTAPITIGTFNASYGASFRGFIDDVRVYNYALDAATVQGLNAGTIE